MIKYITDKQIRALQITSEEQIAWVNDCLRHKQDYDLPAKISINKDDGIFYNTMPTIMEPIGLAGVKCVNRYPDRNVSLESKILLYDFKTGSFDALLDGNEITAMRTGAVAVHSARLFSKKDFKVVAMIGLGNIMRHTAKIFFDTFSDRKIVVKLFRYKNAAEKFINEFIEYGNITWDICDTVVDTFCDADLIFSAVTLIDADFCAQDVYKKGCTIIPIHTRGFIECDLYFDKIFGDDLLHLHEFKYFNQFRSFAEVSSVLLGTAQGRASDDERIIVYNIGLVIHDLYYANKLMKRIDNLQ